MFERFKFGSYRIDDHELAAIKNKSKKTIGSSNQVLIKFLDSTNVKFSLDVSYQQFYQSPESVEAILSTIKPKQRKPVEQESGKISEIAFVLASEKQSRKNNFSNRIFLPQKKAKGCELLDVVFQHLELTERDYFGLKFCESENGEVSHWANR
jgi:hypothetical protein